MAITTVRCVTDGTYSIEQVRWRLEDEGVLTRSEDDAWKYVSDDPTFPTVYFLSGGMIEMHGRDLDDILRRRQVAEHLGKLLGVGVQPVGEA